MSIKTKLPNIEIGVSYSHSFTWSTKDDNGVVTPVDLTNWEGIMQFRKSLTDASVYLEVSTTNNRLSLTGNLIQIEVPTSVTKDLTVVEDGVHDLLLWPTGQKEVAVRLIYGTFSAEKLSSAVPA